MRAHRARRSCLVELTARHTSLAQTLGIGFAVAAPMLVVVNWPPSPTLANQALSLSGWGMVVVLASADAAGMRSAARALCAFTAAMAIAIACAMASTVFGALPSGLALGAIAVSAAAVLVAHVGGALRVERGPELAGALLWGLLLAGLLSSLIALVQVFAPGWADGDWIARATSIPPRAGANLRQPNHLSSLLLWSLIALLGLRNMRPTVRWPWWPAALLLLCLALVLTGSRTGVLGVLVLAAWGLTDRRLTRGSRLALGVLPLVYAALWLGVVSGSHALGHEFAGEGRVSMGGHGDISSSRFAIWSNTLAMIAREPWLGVGFGEFNIAWTLTALPARPLAFFDHTHNLPLQLLVEFGIPLGALTAALLLLALALATRRAWRCAGELGVAKRSALMIVLMIGLHSMLEYPLWYAYFLLPTAFAWGFALAPLPNHIDGNRQPPAAPRGRALRLAGLALSVGAAAALLDYRGIVAIYDPPDNAAPLEARIARGQRSLLFGHHADYAAATAFGPPQAPLSASQALAFRRAPHQLLDVRLLIAWSQALAAQGELDKARWLAARIREFHNTGADEYLAPCADAAEASRSFQCQAPTRDFHWREFIAR